MPKLNDSLIDADSVKSLASCNIFTTYDFIQGDVDKIVSNSNLDIEATLALKHKFITDCSCEPITAYSSYMALQNCKAIKTNIKNFDYFLNGGVNKGSILELCGLAGSGKTQLCLSLALQAALHGTEVEYIDTKLEFSASRCNALLPAELSDREMDKALENITVSTIKNIYELISKIDSLNTNFKNASIEERIVIIDSVTAPYLSLVGISSSKGFSLLNYLATILKKLASSWNCAVIVTNLGAKYFEVDEDEEPRRNINEVKPLLGKYWMHVPNTRILISQNGPFTSERTLSILKSDYLESKKTMEISITEKGVT